MTSIEEIMEREVINEEIIETGVRIWLNSWLHCGNPGLAVKAWAKEINLELTEDEEFRIFQEAQLQIKEYINAD